MQLRVLANNILAQFLREESTTKGGLILPDQSVGNKCIATVLKVGRDCQEVREGDLVLLGKFGGTDVKIEDVDDFEDGMYVLVQEPDIVAVITR